jgi:hypothetical protein
MYVILCLDELDVKTKFKNAPLVNGFITIIWHPRMKEMLGKTFIPLESEYDGFVALPSPDGSQGGKWYFPSDTVTTVSTTTTTKDK